jgi:hypothetical protein
LGKEDYWDILESSFVVRLLERRDEEEGAISSAINPFMNE